MTDITKTAYPQFEICYTEAELERVFQPTTEELAFIRSSWKKAPLRYSALLLLKTTHKLGRFSSLKNIPIEVRKFLAKALKCTPLKVSELTALEKSRSYSRVQLTIREFLDIELAQGKKFEAVLSKALAAAAKTKDNVIDIINAGIEELVKHRFLLPSFDTLHKKAVSALKASHEGYFSYITQQLSPYSKQELDELLMLPEGGKEKTGWSAIRSEPKKVNKKNMKLHVENIKWLQTWVKHFPSIDSIPKSKIQHFYAEAYSYDVSDLKGIPPTKRYALMVIFITQQLCRSNDDLAKMICKKLRAIERAAQKILDKLRRSSQADVDRLLAQYRDLLSQFIVSEEDTIEKNTFIDSLGYGLEEAIVECDTFIDRSENGCFELMIGPYKHARTLLLDSLSILDFESTSSNQTTVKAISFILQNRGYSKKTLPIFDKKGRKLISIGRLSKKWRSRIIAKHEPTEEPHEVNRMAFEIYTLIQVVEELKSADLSIKNSIDFSDFRKDFVSKDIFEKERDEYCRKLGLPENPQALVQLLKEKLANTATNLDENFINNKSLSFNEDGPKLQKFNPIMETTETSNIKEAIKNRLEQKSILDILGEVENWAELHKVFGPLSGNETRLKKPSERLITMLLCYGCNLGPKQTSQSVKELNLTKRKITWLNIHHANEAKIDKANAKILNMYRKLVLPTYWGNGNSVSVDGTRWDVFSDNPTAEYHIRYGRYGGIGYYHVSDQYAAIHSRFISCGVYEGHHVLDGLLNHKSEYSPDTVHGDTHSQSLVGFGLSHLLGIKLMPRIKDIKGLAFFKADKKSRYKHIGQLMKKTINWNLIEKHLDDMLHVAYSISTGALSSSTILRRMRSKKNRLFLAVRELGRAIRTTYLLEYIGNIELRQRVNAATNKSEAFNNFAKWLFYGRAGVISENARFQQNKMIKYNHLVANMVILYNAYSMTLVLKDLEKDGYEISPSMLARLSPYWTSHINRFGAFSVNIKLPKDKPDFSIELLLNA